MTIIQIWEITLNILKKKHLCITYNTLEKEPVSFQITEKSRLVKNVKCKITFWSLMPLIWGENFYTKDINRQAWYKQRASDWRSLVLDIWKIIRNWVWSCYLWNWKRLIFKGTADSFCSTSEWVFETNHN